MKLLFTKALTVAAIAGLTCAGFAQKIKVGGYLDGYYQFDFGRPTDGDSLNGRGLDIAHNRPTIAFGQLDLSLDPRPWGFNLQLYAGRGPEIIHLTEPGGRDKYRYVHQAYASYVTPGRTPITIDIGKFDSWIGYEGIDNRTQEEYSRSFNWTYSEPVYETGVRFSGKVFDQISASFYIVQGWNEVEDGNGSKSIGLLMAYAPNPDTSYAVQTHYGVEGSTTANDVGSYGGIGFINPGTSRVHLTDLIVSRQITHATKVTLNADYGSSGSISNQGNWNGEVVYLRHQMSPTRGIGLRADRFEDSDGLRTGSPVQLYSLTGNYDYVLNTHLTFRFELRHDVASQAFFNSDGGPARDRTTLTAAAVVKY